MNLGFWNFRFSDFRFSRFFVWENIVGKMLVRYRGINNKGVLERPWTKWRVLEAISTTLKCQFTGKCWKVDFSMPCKTKLRDILLRCLRTVRAVTLDTSRPPQFQPELCKKQFLWKKPNLSTCSNSFFLPEMDQYVIVWGIWRTQLSLSALDQSGGHRNQYGNTLV